MTENNSTLRRQFANGAESGQNHTGSMEIETLRNGNTALVGYGWCLYGERDSDTGEITVYDGWAEWAQEQGNNNAQATPRHIDRLKEFADNVESNNPQTAAPPASVREIGRMGLELENISW